MDFNKARFVNFLTLSDSGDIYLRNRGLNLLQGVNEDDTSATSNGAGKSSLVDGLCWTLYDATARKETGDAVVNNKAKKDCSGRVSWLDGDTMYEVSRFRKDTKNKNELHFRCWAPASGYPSGTPTILTGGTSALTQIEIVKQLGCTHEVFVASIYAGQEDMPDIPKMTDKTLKMLIEEAAGIQKLETAYKIASADHAVIVREVADAKMQVDRVNNDITASTQNLEMAKLRGAEFDEKREGRAQPYDEAAAAEKLAATELVTQVRAIDSNALTDRAVALTAAIGLISTQRAAVEARRTDLRPMQDKYAGLMATLKTTTEQALALRSRFDNAHLELDKPCDACGKSHLLEEVGHLRTIIKGQLVEKVTLAKSLTETTNGLMTDIVSESALIDLAAKAIPDASDLTAQMSAVAAEQLKLSQLTAKAHAHIATSKQRSDQAAAVRAEVNPQFAVIDLCTKQITDANARKVMLQAHQEVLAEKLDYSEAIVQVYSPAGMRAHILDTVTPFLNDRTADYLATLSDGNISAVWSTLSKTAKGELREKFAIEVTNGKGGQSFGLISGGEKKKVRLACMLALQDLVASRASKPINLWIGDEIDAAVDDAGLERLMTILEKKARERGTVVIISHSDLKDWCDLVTTITKSGGQSTVSGALTEFA